MNLRGKFRVIVGIAAVGLLGLTGFWLNSQRSDLLSERVAKTKNLVEVPYSLIAEQHRLEAEGKISREEAQRRALEAIRPMRYEGTNYFFVNDMHQVMLAHPKPGWTNKDLTDLKDPTGKAIIVEFVNVVRTSHEGFVFYEWPKPGSDKPVKKLTFVKGFEPWGWVVGTGLYIEDIDAAWRKDGKLAAFLALSCLVVLLIVSMRVYRSIFVRFQKMIECIKDVAEGERDLTKRIAITCNDEVAELAAWVNRFIDKVQEILSQVSSNSQGLAAASEEISASSRDQARGAELQQDQTNQVATAMQEMATTVHEVSDHSSKGAAASQKAAETAREGGKIVDETLSRMRAIAHSVGETAKKVHELGKRSDEIGRITGVIEDIADQTNLLALNAAIEAARAGEQGRGFAVVADEVRKLAERTGNATKEIAEMIRTIQSETKTAVAAMNAGSKEVELGVESTSRAGSSLHDIIRTSEQVGDMVTQIATAATQQSATTEHINSNIEEIARIASSTVTGAQQTAAALHDLAQVALNLQQLVGQFRLSADGAAGNGCSRSRASQLDQAVSNSLDFGRVKMAHRSWRLKLRSFLDGRENIDPAKLASHRGCELGKWIYASGMAAFGHFQEMADLEKRHKDMHALVKQVVELKHAGKASEAEQEFSRVCEAGEEVIALITRVEARVIGSRAHAVESVKPRAAAQATLN
ncbi:MAG: methyl-accepting chemotaxis protein [Terriglobales bacterium]